MDTERDRVQQVEIGTDATVVGVATAGIVSVVITEETWDLFDSMVGIVLLLVLLGYGKFRRQVLASVWEAAAVGAVFAFCVVLVFGPLIDDLQGWLGWPPFAAAYAEWRGFWFLTIWIVLTVVLTAFFAQAGPRLLHPRYRRHAADRGDG